MSKRHAAIGFAIAVAASSTAAQGQTTFQMHRLNILGNKNIDAVSINDQEDIAASLFDDTNASQSGIVIHGDTAITLPAPYDGSPYAVPQAINAHGDVVGYAPQSDGGVPLLFLWHGGQYEAAAQIGLELVNPPVFPPLPIGVSDNRKVFFTNIRGLQDPTAPTYGKLDNLKRMPNILRYQYARGINKAGVIAGNAAYESETEVFVGRNNKFTVLLPPGAVSSNGGFINENGEVAGTYIDNSKVPHGFTWISGKYTSFDLPEPAQAFSVTIGGINSSGRVVGSYISTATSRPHAFLFNGSTVTAFGDYNPTAVVSTSLNNRGTIVVAVQSKQNSASYASYRVRCSGSGC